MTLDWLAAEPLILASGSATRQTMLEAAGLPVDVIKPAIDERAVEAPLLSQRAPSPAIAAALACAKALAVSRDHPARVVLGADQTLDLDGQAFHKPRDAGDAALQLAALSGRIHHLHSAFVLVRDGEILAEGASQAAMTMRDLSPDAIAAYLAAAGPDALQSVGCYQIEGPGIRLFTAIEGDHFTILGLPLLGVLAALREHGLLSP